MEDADGRRPEEIHEWIGSYARRGWPDTTPGFAVREYPDLLAASGDAARLSALARDPDRHAFLLRVTGSDYAAQAEIAAAQRLVAAQDEPDLQALMELAVYRHGMSIRNQCLPSALPGAWARLGRLDHGEALARAFTHPDLRAGALEDVATAAAEAGNLDRAEALAGTIADPLHQVWALANLETAAAQAGDQDRAVRLAAEAKALAGTIAEPNHRGQALDALASVAAQAGDLDRAEALARSMTIAFQQARTLTELAGLAAGPAIRTGPRPWPAPSQRQTTWRGRWPSWPAWRPGPATRTAPPGWPPRPRRWPAPSPTRRITRRCSVSWPRRPS